MYMTNLGHVSKVMYTLALLGTSHEKSLPGHLYTLHSVP